MTRWPSARWWKPNFTTVPASMAARPGARRRWMHFSQPFQSLPFDSACVPEYARIREHLESQGSSIGANDLLIAAIALTHGLTVITNNTDEFKRVPGLRVEDWSA